MGCGRPSYRLTTTTTREMNIYYTLCLQVISEAHFKNPFTLGIGRSFRPNSPRTGKVVVQALLKFGKLILPPSTTAANRKQYFKSSQSGVKCGHA